MGAPTEIQLFLIGLAIIAANSWSNLLWGNIGDIKHKYWELAQNEFLARENDRQASVAGNRG